MRKCVICNNEIPEYVAIGGRKRIYCSDECRYRGRLNTNNNRLRKKREANLKKGRTKRKVKKCIVCGEKLQVINKVGNPGKCCPGECAFLNDAFNQGNIKVLFGALVVKNERHEQGRLYAKTINEIAEELDTPPHQISIEITRALFKFKALWEHHFKFDIPKFEEDEDDSCWDDLYNYMQTEYHNDYDGLDEIELYE